MLNVYPSSEHLAELAEGLRRRSRALKHSGGELRCERTIERFEDRDREKLEVTFRRRPNTKSVTVRLFAWSDRWVWIDAREPTKQGWKWEWTAEGRVSGAGLGKKIVDALERTIAASGEASETIQDDLQLLWKPLLATGPGPNQAGSRPHGT